MKTETPKALARTTTRLLLIVAALSGGSASAQLTAAGGIQPYSPFDVTGVLQQATFGNCPGSCGGSDALAGGTLTVNGQVIIVPRNSIVQFPASWRTWKQVFDDAPEPYRSWRQSGLALADGDGTAATRPITGFEVHVLGNRINGVNVAGLVSISQHSLMQGQGFITFIDYVTGEFRVGGQLNDPNCIPGAPSPACSGQRVKINDPLGRFGRVWSPDTRFTIDEENPTVRAGTGFPMCLPRTDPGAGAGDALCPQTNRPRQDTGVPETTFYMMDPAFGMDPNPYLMAPLLEGDYVTYSGILIRDGAMTLVAAYAVVANLSIFTWESTNPAYVVIEDALLGVGGIAVPGFPQEASIRTVFEGFTTDPTRNVEFWAQDVDPCTGAVQPRYWGSAVIDPGPPTGAVLGRFRFRPPDRLLTMPMEGVFLPAARELAVVIEGYGPNELTLNGLLAGQYVSPIGEFIFPEQAAPGLPPVALTLNEFPFLMDGSGPWPGTGGAIAGRLDPAPWDPSLNAPPTGCTPPPTLPAPTASVVSTLTVNEGQLVTLDASASSSNTTPPLPLAYQWAQTGPATGPFVILSNATVASPSFTAPDVAADTNLTFRVTVTTAGGTATASVTVTVKPVIVVKPPVAVLTAPSNVVSGALVTLNATSSHDDNVPASVLSYAYAQVSPATPALVITPAGATATFKAPIVSVATTFTFKVTVSSALGLSAVSSPVSVTVGPASPPVVLAVPNQSLMSGNPPTGKVTLTGQASDPNGLPLTYTWTQTSGPTAVVLSPGGPSTSPVATFNAPTLPVGAASVTYRFQLSVTNGATAPVTTTTTVTIAAPDRVTITSVSYRTSQQRLTVTATTSASSTSGVTMSFKVASPAPNGATVQMTSAGGTPLTFTGTLTGTPNPDGTGGVTVTSSLGGKATSLVTQLR